MNLHVLNVTPILDISQSDLLRFCIKFFIGSDGCWHWTGSKDPEGYGYLRYGIKCVRASRFSYSAFKGPIPSGFTIDHLCRNSSCVNPDHLEAVTQHVNNHRAAAWLPRKNRTHCVHGHEFDKENTKITKSGKRRCRACDRFQVKAARIASLLGYGSSRI